METVLHKPTPPPNEKRWHIHLRGHPEDLLCVLKLLSDIERDVIRTAEFTAEDKLLICLCWVDEVMPHFVTSDIENKWSDIKILKNGKEECHGHNIHV